MSNEYGLLIGRGLDYIDDRDEWMGYRVVDCRVIYLIEMTKYLFITAQLVSGSYGLRAVASLTYIIIDFSFPKKWIFI